MLVRPEFGGLSVRKQCALVHVSRSSLYYEPVETSAEELALMRQIDELHLEHPYYGSRRMAVALGAKGHQVNRKHMQRLMRVMGIEGMAPGPSTSKPHPQHTVYPYLLRGVTVERADQVWATDITYLPMEQGYAYLVAIMDWFSRAVLAWRVSNSLMVDFCLEALEEALRRFGPPEIFNSDQGSQFTDRSFVALVEEAGARMSMDGRGRWRDNVFTERLWRSLKYEEVYLKAYEDVRGARQGIASWFRFYNHDRPHQALGYATPMKIYRASQDRRVAT
jgi:putative transposase